MITLWHYITTWTQCICYDKASTYILLWTCAFCSFLEHIPKPEWWKTTSKINRSMTQGDGPQNYSGLSLTDCRLHAPLLPGHYGCVEALVTWGADVDMDIPHMGTALYTACVCQELECARTLLREGQPAVQRWSLHLCTQTGTRPTWASARRETRRWANISDARNGTFWLDSAHVLPQLFILFLLLFIYN